MNKFEKTHPKVKKWIREGGLFFIFSYVVTFLKWILLTFLPIVFYHMIGDVVWTWPGIRMEIFGVSFTLAVIGNDLVDGGLAFTLSNLLSIIIGECINFPLQRNITFRSKGAVRKQIFFHFLATFGVFFIMNLFTCIWNPITAAMHLPNAIRNIVTTIATGGVSMIIIFAVDRIIFADNDE